MHKGAAPSVLLPEEAEPRPFLYGSFQLLRLFRNPPRDFRKKAAAGFCIHAKTDSGFSSDLGGHIRFSLNSVESFQANSGGNIFVLSRSQHINPVRFSNALTHPHDKSGGFQLVQRTLHRHGAAGQRLRQWLSQGSRQTGFRSRPPVHWKHSVQHPAVHDLCGAADWKSCQRSGKGHTWRQRCVYRHKFKIHSVCSSFFFARLDK
jgi:hypothetical protein